MKTRKNWRKIKSSSESDSASEHSIIWERNDGQTQQNKNDTSMNRLIFVTQTLATITIAYYTNPTMAESAMTSCSAKWCPAKPTSNIFLLQNHLLRWKMPLLYLIYLLYLSYSYILLQVIFNCYIEVTV